MTEHITAALDALQRAAAPSSFACRLTLPTDALALAVDGVGEIDLPVPKAQAKALASVARPAPYGLGERTLVDRTVRDVGEIERRRLRIDGRRWRRSLTPALERIRTELGLPDGTLEARPDKLLVYEKGQFFLPHRDTERADDMLGTLVVVLPSAHRGGTLVVEHRGETCRFAAPRANAAPALTLLAFYADCVHEVKPVTAGTRVALSCRLHFTAAGEDGTGLVRVTTEEGLEALVAAVGEHFDRGGTDETATGSFRSQRTRKLVCLLDHEYSGRSLAWPQLKGADAIQALMLRYAAVALDLRPWLALVDIDESWYALDEGSGDYDVQELIERGASLTGWRDAKSTPRDFPSLYAWESELCGLEALADAEPDEQEYEGYMGNYGETLERRYHRSAIVLWPDDLHYRTLMEMGPITLVRELLDETASGDEADVAAARTTFRAVAGDWEPGGARGDADAFGDALKLAERFAEPDLALTLLASFRLDAIRPDAMPALLALGARLGAPFRRRLVARWMGDAEESDDDEPLPSSIRFMDLASRAARGTYRFVSFGRGRLTWLDTFATFCTQARRREKGIWLDVLPGMFDGFHAELRAVHARNHAERTPSERAASLDAEVSDLVALLDAARALDDPAAGGRVLAALDEALDDYDPEVPVRVIEQLAKRPETFVAALPAGTLDALRRRTGEALETALAASARAKGDWRIDAELDCDCEDCRKLRAFLGARDAQALDLPLAAPRRGHLHGKIDERELPVSHETLRQGRPYVLQLRKRQTLFRDARRQHARIEALIERLGKVRSR